MKTMILIASLLAAPLVHAHVSLEQKSAAAGSYQKLTFRVGHGCAGSATTAITIALPEAIGGVKPMPKSGWTVSGSARDVSWRGGPLPDSQYDEFSLWLKLPDAPGKHAFKVVQQCEQGRAEWSELPGVAGKFPAPVLEILPAAATGPLTPAAAAPVHQH
ncbi:MAG TPA: YcnI family protein [Telluria sp.]|nr:YcnI family protein [Telluria sp.]